MKIMLVNGSPRENGCTTAMLCEIQKEFEKLGVESEIFWIGSQVNGCINCRYCKNTGKGCKIKNDTLSLFLDKMKECEGLIIGSPVYYGDISGQLNNFLTRAFYSSCKSFKFKPCAGIVTARRSGCTSAFNRLNMFFLMHSMIVVGNQYWNNGHGDTPDELTNDVEGKQSMRTLAVNMKWVAECLNKVEKPEHEKYTHTNFISREFLGYKEAFIDNLYNY